jgi:two-component system response regulator AtoC
MDPIKILIVDDASATRDYLSELVQIIGYQAKVIEHKTQFVSTLHTYSPDLLLLGSSCHAWHVRAFAEVVEREKKGTPILFVRDGVPGHGGENLAESSNVSSLPKNFNSADLRQAVERLVNASKESEEKQLGKTIVGKSPRMVQIKRQVGRLSKSDVTVLIRGESGTGKELAARAIHQLSLRREKPFVKVNSAALPSNLLESELFGFEKGAFTGAFHKKPGKFELAHSGTIFLDEISELAVPLQAKLLQVLQDNEVSSLGSTENTRVDVRVMAATNANLGEMVRTGQFRSDLYFRINVVSILMPPLRERKEDIGLLCQHFVDEYSSRYGRSFAPIKNETMHRLHNYDWPGNVRELQNFIQGIAILGDEKMFHENIGNNGPARAFANGKRAVGGARRASNGATSVGKRSLKQVCKAAARQAETEAILDALLHTRWNRFKAANLLKVSYKTLLTKIKEYGIEQLEQE